MTTNIIDPSMHLSSFPTTYTGNGTLVGNTTQGAGVPERVNGNFTSNGNATQINSGFLPTHIYIVNTTDGITWEWMQGMPAANSVKTTLGGSLASVQDTGSAFTITKDGSPGNVCSVTLSATLCGTSKNICFEIYG